ncbi:MAG TPA: transglycosylase domain-containing protein [Methylomirabilota bacterium]|nr:transglycosylase domain-containing protein [Methylomirabilota bacterium]
MSRSASPRGLAATQPALATGVLSPEMLAGAARPWSARLRALLSRRYILIPLVGVVLALAALVEMRTSVVQALVLSRAGAGLTYRVEGGPSPAIHFPRTGPYDERLGYTRLGSFIDRLEAAGYRVERQARLSPGLDWLAGWGVAVPYREKTRAGLEVLDRERRRLYATRYPEQVYQRFEAVPPLLVDTLLFIENRELLDTSHPYRNPVVDWRRLAKAIGIEALGRLGDDRASIGASTLPTQLEKMRHSPDGRTRSAADKLHQMVSASLRVYQGGARTGAVRRQIVTDYLDSLPLAAAPGHGEVHGLGDGLRVWYGTDFSEANALLTAKPAVSDAARGRVFKRALSLILAARRPYHYLVEQPRALEEFTDSYLRVLARAGVIDAGLRDAALVERLDPRGGGETASVAFVDRKGANLVRSRLTTLLNVPGLYDLDRFDLTAYSTLDAPAQDAASRLLRSLREPATIERLGLVGDKLLGGGDPGRVLYSVTVYERGPGANRVRIQTDNLEQPLDINGGARIDLGSTAKLRTLLTYLEVIAGLHDRYARLEPAELAAVRLHPRDRLGAWAVEYLTAARGTDRSLQAMLEVSLERRYSASPAEAFFTGGGLHTFGNFDREDDRKVLSIREAFQNSVNLVFIRLMRDVVSAHLYSAPTSLAVRLDDPLDPRRLRYLTRFADREGSEFIRRFYRKYQGLSAEAGLEMVLSGTRQTPHGLAAALRSVYPEASLEVFRDLLATRLPGRALADPAVEELYHHADPQAMPLADRGYVAGVHPLELWLVGYLRRHPGASMTQVVRASSAERQAVYSWLFFTRHRNAQDHRIASLLELEAFLEIHRSWERLGYPFASLTPSLATAIGSSGDRPAALAELMGIILNGGVRLPTVLVERLDFAADTPYETRLGRAETPPTQVLAPEVAAVARGLLTEVVAQGTARGLRPALAPAGGVAHVAGGKTGTGDHRYYVYGKNGGVVESRVVSRAATFVFMLDDRYFGTVTAYVPGPEAARFHFTSGLPVRILGLLVPTLERLSAPAPVTASAPSVTASSASR